MTDIIIPKKLRLIDSKEMHGHIRLDIHNTRSGFTERIEQDNLVTDAANEFMWRNALCAFHGDGCYYGFSVYGGVFGGVFLFKDSINTSGNMLPFGANRLIGYAGNSTDVQGNRGYYNAAESQFNVTEGVAKTVWDWGTQQANGQISAVARTHLVTGNGYFGRDRSNYTLFQCRPYDYTDHYYFPIGIDKANKKIYCLRGTNVYETSYSVELSNARSATRYMPRKESQFELVCSSGLDISYRHWLDLANGKIYAGNIVSSGGDKIKLYVVDIATKTLTETTLTLTGCRFFAYYYYQPESLAVAFSDGFMYVSGYDPNDNTKYGIYKIELADTTNVTFYNTSDEATSYGYSSIEAPTDLVPWGVSGLSFTIRCQRSGNYFTKEMLMDQDGHFYFNEPYLWGTTGSGREFARAEFGSALGAGVDEEPVDFYNVYASSDSPRSTIYLATDYMASIANLGTPVTKTSSETLKLTYTLSDS